MLDKIVIALCLRTALAFPNRRTESTPDHGKSAPDVTSTYPYANSVGGRPGTNTKGWLVPAEGDTAHEWQAPEPGDITGPCPGGELEPCAFLYVFLRAHTAPGISEQSGEVWLHREERQDDLRGACVRGGQHVVRQHLALLNDLV